MDPYLVGILPLTPCSYALTFGSAAANFAPHLFEVREDLMMAIDLFIKVMPPTPASLAFYIFTPGD